MKRFLSVFFLISFIFIGIFGVNLGMTYKDGKMINCPLSSNSLTPCHMGLTQHIAKWQQIFQALPFTSASLLFLLGMFFVAIVFYTRTLSALSPPASSRLNSYQQEHLGIGLDKLLLAFSSGILHPKIYA